MAKAQEMKGKKKSRKAPETVWVPSATEEAESLIGDAYDFIHRYKYGEEDDYGNVVDEERLIERLDEIHAWFGELVQDDWEGYRETMDELSNRLWELGVAWPQHLPYWSWADVVLPGDLKKKISKTCLYQKDLIAIREYADAKMWRFKDTVHFLVNHARKTLNDFSEAIKVPKKKRR